MASGRGETEAESSTTTTTTSTLKQYNKRKRQERSKKRQKKGQPAADHIFASLLPNKYDLILVDPPWDYLQNSQFVRGAAAHKYSMMSDDDVAALPIKDIASPGAYLLLWTTGPKLPFAFDVLEIWGFQFKTVFLLWIKTQKHRPELPITNGLGYYTRSCCEFLLLARSKDAERKLIKDVKASSSVQQLLMAPRREHSRKPDESFGRIDAFFKPGLSKVELFARQSRPGWDVWGNETTKFDEQRQEQEEEEADVL